MSVDWSGRWSHVQKFLERTGPFAHPDFEPSSEAVSFLQDVCKILVIGAGGLGCELLKDLALLGFRNLDVIDMDTIDISNLNRQFLFRLKDVGRPKAECAADFINTRIPGTKVTPHCNRIEDFDESFYRQFHIVVCGLDSIVARRWINGMLISMLNYEDGQLDQSSIVPLVDGGTEGLKGNARVILPGISACVECTLDLYPPQGIGFQKIYVCKTPPDSATKPYTALSPTVFVGKTLNFPLCTIAHTPRLPEHCIEYVRILLWPKEEPFGGGVGIDGDDPKHIQWILDRSLERASEFNITGITYRLTQGVVKRIIPAVASTNAVIAAACATEVFKIATSCCLPLNNYMNFNDTEGIYTYTFEAEKKDDCMACGSVPQTLSFSEDDKLQDIINFLIESVSYQMKSPGVTTSVNGKNRTLYMQTVKSIEERTKQNLKKTLKELGLSSGQELYVADATTPNSLTFKLNLGSKME